MILLNFIAKVLVFHVLLIPVITLLGAMILLTLIKLKKLRQLYEPEFLGRP